MIKSTPRFVDVFIPNTVDSVMSDSPASKVGIKAGDKIVKFNNTPIASYNDFVEATGRIADVLASTKNPSDSAKALKATISFVHQGDTAVQQVPITLTKDAKVGIFAGSIMQTYKVTHISYGFLESFPAGVKHGMKVLSGYVGDMKYLLA